MPEPILIQSYLREYEVLFPKDPTVVAAEVADPKAFTIADPAVVDVFEQGTGVQLDRTRMYLLEPSEERKRWIRSRSSSSGWSIGRRGGAAG